MMWSKPSESLLSPYGSVAPVGACPMPKQPAMESSLSAILTRVPGIPSGSSLPALIGR